MHGLDSKVVLSNILIVQIKIEKKEIKKIKQNIGKVWQGIVSRDRHL